VTKVEAQLVSGDGGGRLAPMHNLREQKTSSSKESADVRL
jgi:hypothetical protein